MYAPLFVLNPGFAFIATVDGGMSFRWDRELSPTWWGLGAWWFELSFIVPLLLSLFLIWRATRRRWGKGVQHEQGLIQNPETVRADNDGCGLQGQDQLAAGEAFAQWAQQPPGSLHNQHLAPTCSAR